MTSASIESIFYFKSNERKQQSKIKKKSKTKSIPLIKRNCSRLFRLIFFLFTFKIQFNQSAQPSANNQRELGSATARVGVINHKRGLSHHRIGIPRLLNQCLKVKYLKGILIF